MITKEAIEAAARALCRYGTSFQEIGQTLSWVDEKWPRFAEEAALALSAALSVPAAAVVGEPVGYLFEMHYGNGRWSGTMFAESINIPAEDVRNVRPLYAAPSAPDGWQSIETAPRDGTVIMAWHTVHRCPMSVVWKEPGHPFNGEVLNWYEKSYTTAWPERCFSHWQPLLPAPPALGGASHE